MTTFPVGTLAIAKERSGNAKLGDCATTYAAQQSCPSDCVFYDGGGCYAETGRLGKFVTAPLNAAAEGLTALDVAYAEAEAIDALAAGDSRPLRLHTVGDCKTDETAEIVARAAERYMDRGGGPVWTYTHAWRSVARSSWGRVSVLASCETANDVRDASARGYATALVVEQFESDALYEIGTEAGRVRTLTTEPRVDVDLGRYASNASVPMQELPHGHKLTAPSDEANGRGGGAPVTSAPILPCPAQTRDRTCATCRLCFDDEALRERGYSIGFAVHGIPLTARRAKLALSAPDDPQRRVSAEDRLRVLLIANPDLSAHAAAKKLALNEGYAGQLLAFLRGQADHPSELRRQRYDRKKAAR